MAFAAPLIPYLTAAGAAYGAVSQSNAASYNAKVTGQEQKLSVDQGNAGANMVRRASRESLGRQSAAFGAAGVGYGGSSEGALDQSAVNQEMDALNTKYKGTLTGYGYGVQSGLDQSESKQYAGQAGLLAGSALLKGMNFAPPSLQQQSGLQAPGS